MELQKIGLNHVDRVDNAAYYHDLAYNQHTDTASRNVADRAMINDLNNIPNPSLRERIERAIVKPILFSKASLGLGFLKKLKITTRSEMD